MTRRLPGKALHRLAAEHEVTVWPGDLPPSREELLAHAAQADGLLSLLTERIDAEVLAAAPRLRVVSNYAVGVDNIDVAAATARGIPVGHTPDVLTEATADMAMALLLAVARHVVAGDAAVRAGRWRTWEPQGFLGLELAGATIGVVGFGRIGQALARRAEGFGMRVLPIRRHDAPRLHEALAACDVVSLHAPLTPETWHLIDERALAAMKPTAILVNTARGPLVDTAALERALRAGTIAGAGLDVTDPEPLPAGHPLLSAPNLVVTPHIASATHRTRGRMADIAVDNLLAGLAGRPLPHCANPEVYQQR